MTLHESKNAGYPDLGRLHRFAGDTPSTPSMPSIQAIPMAHVTPLAQTTPPPRTAPSASSTSPAPPAPPARRRPRRTLYDQADLGSHTAGDDCFDRLARLAEPENWAGANRAKNGAKEVTGAGGPSRSDESSESNGVKDAAGSGPGGTWMLREYVEWTFERLHRQRRVLTSPEGDHSVFNTGLATPRQETIYGLFVPSRNPDGAPWQLDGWSPESDPRLHDAFPELPGLATYTEDPADFVYDWRCELSADPRHLLEARDNRAALPGPLRSNPYQAGLLLEGAIRRAAARVRRNHRTAVPCWDPVRERVHLLLPLSLTTPESVDVALVTVRDGAAYRGLALFGLDLAHARARLIARPEEWLSPGLPGAGARS